ncbi:MAG: cysteine hydrolase [Gammaproteobacteria bacterium]|nr:cysteine hydrolase [Gammaproteobacteria bacterium]
MTEATALLVIDVQKGLTEATLGERNNPDAEANMAQLLAACRAHRWPIVHIRHCSVEPASALRPELPGNAYKDEVLPLAGEKEFTKSVNSAFIGTGLEQYLRDSGISKLVIIGLTTDHCISSSTRMASDLGFDVTLVTDATAAFERNSYDGVNYSADEIHRVNLVSLGGEFCRLRSTAQLLDALT